MEIESGRSERGFALPMALIVLALLTALAMGLSQIASIKSKQSFMRQQQFQGYLSVQDAFQTAVFRLLTGVPGGRMLKSKAGDVLIDGTPFHLAGLSCRVQDVAGLLSLGLYNEQQLKELLLRLTNKKNAEKLAAELGDWIDADDRPRYLGLEVSDYEAMGWKAHPRNGLLRNLDELLELPAMTPALFNGDKRAGKPGLRDLLAVGGVEWFNAAAAPEILLGVSLHLSDKQATEVIRARKKGDWAAFNELIRLGGASFGGYDPDMASAEFRMYCSISSGLPARIQFRLQPTFDTPFLIQSWQYPDYDRF